MMNTAAKPFLKWAGGKGQLLSQLDQHLPKGISRIDFTYLEPFVGGGAMLFHILQQFPNIKKAVINDINSYLITAYRVIKNSPDELIKRLSELENQYYSTGDNEDQKSFFLRVRETFNEVEMDDVDRTKYLIFLNRTCFNGLYRVNSKGKFNVPFGRYLHPTICNAETIKADSELLNRVELVILNGDFERTIEHLSDGFNLFYFDPPYRPLNATSSFNSYSKEDFNDEEQIRLRDFCARLSEYPNVKWMLSNADCSAKNPEDTFFHVLYEVYNRTRLFGKDGINYIIIRNYQNQ